MTINNKDIKCTKFINCHGPMSVLDPLSSRLNWLQTPRTAFVTMKPDGTLIEDFVKIISYLIEKKITVFVERPECQNLLQRIPRRDERWKSIVQVEKEMFKKQQESDPEIDFIISLGGDGTLIRATSFFPRMCPPVLPFNSGSLGFLNPFNCHAFEKAIDKMLKGDAPVLVRFRLNLKILLSESSEIAHESVAMNEIVIDRGAYAYLTNIDMHINDRFITKVQGDGLIVSTPTGSTAYAMAAGASMVHPSVDAMIVCPICPHSLSFRPIIVPQKIKLKLTVPETARNSAWLSVDGQHISEVNPGHSIEITSADYPVPCICDKDQISDWFESLAQCLHWNLRSEQKPLRPVKNDDRV